MVSRPRPLASSLSRLSSVLAVCAALSTAAENKLQAAISWDGGGANFLWEDALNWSGDVLPTPADDLTFGIGTTSTIRLVRNQTANSLNFTQSFSLGDYGTNLVLTNTTGNISVAPGVFATMNASYGGVNGITLSGGGSLFLNHPLPTFAGNITVDGAGTTLVHRAEGPAPQYNGVGGTQTFGRFDSLSLGFIPTARTITLTNGGEYKILAVGNNNEGGGKNVVVGAGGGTYNLPAGFQQWNLDDVGQISSVAGNTLTKSGAGRLTITGALADANPLAGDVVVNGGIFELSRLQAGATTANTRYAGITGTTSSVVGTNSLTINNGGVLMLNSTTVGNLDVASVIANDGAILTTQSGGNEIGLRTQGGATASSTLQINGTVSMLHRDYFGVQTGRNFFINSDLTGSGVLQILPSTQATSVNQRVVIQRSINSTFDGTFRLTENANLEANPRLNAVAETGKVLAGGDIEFAGWGSTLDLRDSDAATGLAATVKDYTNNEVSVTSTQAGGINFISPGRAGLAFGTGNLINFGTLTIGSNRLAIAGNNSYQTGFADTSLIKGNAVIEMRSDGSHLVFSNPVAITEDAAGRSLTFVKTGVGNAAARDVISGGTISVSNLEVSTGTLNLRGASGAITTAFGGAAPVITVNGGANSFTNGLPTQGVLNLDSNLGHVVGSTTVFAAGVNNDRIADSATLNLRSNSILRLTSPNNGTVSETLGTTNVSGHGTFDIAKTGTATAPVVLTINSLNLTGSSPTVNFTGGSLGLAGANTSRIVLPGTQTGFLPAQYHSGNEWAKYDSTPDSGAALGVTPFVLTDYAVGGFESDWAPGMQVKQNGTSLPTLTGNRTADRFNFQTTVTNQALDLAGFTLTAAQGGIISSANTIGFVDGPTGTTPSITAGLTAGTTASPAQLYVYSNAQIDIRTPIRDNAAGGSVDFVKNGPGTVRLIHQNLAVGSGATGINPYTATPWTSTLTGSWIINDGRLDVQRGEFLGGRPVILNGGHLEINQPVSNANADSIIPGWGNNIVINGNATVAADDNGESADANTGDRALVQLGSLTINNGSTLGISAFSDIDLAFMGGATFNGKATINTGIGRGNANQTNIISGVLAGSGFDMVGYNGAAALTLGGTQLDATNNTYNGTVTVYAGTLRLNKANGFTAITDGTASEDVIINGGALLWGPGQHGDLALTNSISTTNNGIVGIAPTSPAAIKNAGMNQIADTATVTLLSGTLGESDRITNEKFGTLIQKNGTINVGLGTMEVSTAFISGGAMGFDRGGTFKVGTLNYLPGAYNQSVFTGLPTPTGHTTLDVGAGGISLTGQNITLGNGFSGNVAGSGGLLKLGGNVTVTGTPLVGNSYNTGIYVQNGASFRELGGSRIDLAGGTRDFNIASDVQFYITPRIVNGGISKSGGGELNIQPYEPNTFAGPVIVNAGVLSARSDGAFGTSAGGVTINAGGTVKLDSGWSYGDTFTVSGAGALIPGDANVRELGALVSETGTNRLTGGFVLAGNATVASNTVLDPSVAPGANGAPYKISNLLIEGAGGVTGTGTLTLSGHGDGTIFNGLNTASGGLVKDGAGRWTIAGGSSFTGATSVLAGELRITNAGALGGTAAGTTVFGGSLEVAGGITVAEPLTLFGGGSSTRSGALVSVAGANVISAPIVLGADSTIRSDSTSLRLAGVTAASSLNANLTLSGSGAGVVAGALATGSNGALIKEGTGTWTLSGANTFGSTTTVNGGGLVLDYTTNNGSKISSTAPLSLSGGSVTINGNATAATSQSVAGLNLMDGGSTVSVVSNGGQTANLNVGVITRSGAATVNFNLPAAGGITTANANNLDLLGNFATVGGTNWATVSGSKIVAFSGYTPLDPLGNGSGIENARVTAAQAQIGSPLVNSLKIDNSAGIALGFNNLTLASGGLLYAGDGNAGISGSGLIAGFSPTDELVIHTSGGVLGISSSLIGTGTGNLTKAGAGELRLYGTNQFTGTININGGLLTVPSGVAYPGTLGASLVSTNRLIAINGGAFQVLGDYDLNDYDTTTAGVQSLQFSIGTGGGTLRSQYGSLIINDAGQLQGPGNVVFTGGGRYALNGTATQFTGFGGKVTVDGGILTVSHSASLGGRAEQTLTLKPGSAVINQAGFGLGVNGLPNNIVAGGGVEFYSLSANRVYAGDVQLAGRNTVALMERDNLVQERQVYFNGRVSGSDVTLDVFGVNNANPMYLTGGSNDLTGTINLNTSAVLEARTPGSVGVKDGDVTINLVGANSRLLLRNYQNGDYHTNVVVSDNAEINADRLTGFTAGTSQLLSINNLTASGANKILTIGGGNAYTTRVGGSATLSGDVVLNSTNNILFENGINYAGGATVLDKRGGGSVILRGAANNSGPTIVQQGFLILQGANGALPNSSSIEVRGGELRIDNSDAINTNRINDAGALVLGGGTVRITGAETLPTVTAKAGTTSVVNNPTSDTVVTPLTLTGFTRQLGAVVQFQAPDFGGAVGSATFGQSRVSSRILIPGLADTTQTIPGFVGNNNLDFIQYDGSTVDNGVVLGVRDMRNPTSANSPSNYTNDPAESVWSDSVIARLSVAADNTTTTTTLTADRGIDAIKIEPGGTGRVRQIDVGTFQLRVEGGGILAAAGTTSTVNINGTGSLTAGSAFQGQSTAELFIGGNQTITINPAIVDNGTQSVALVKTGTATLNLNGVSSYTGGTFVTSGTLNVTTNSALGGAANSISLSGGTLLFNVSDAGTNVDLGGFGQNIRVDANSSIVMDNGVNPTLDNNLALGGLTVGGPYTVGIRGLDSVDLKLNGVHSFTGTPTIDLPQATSGSNPNTVATASVVTLAGPIIGSGFFVSSSGNVNDTAARLQIGGGEFDDNTYSGKVTLLPGSNNEDLFVELNKAAGTKAITGDLQLDGGTILSNADEQIADSSNLLINRGVINFNGKSEAIASVTMKGGGFITNPTTGVQPTNTINIAGDVEVSGYTNFAGVNTGFTIGNNSTVNIGGLLRIGTFGRVHLAEGQAGAILNVNGGLEMTGAMLHQNNGAGANIVRLNSDVTILPSASISNLGDSTDSDTYLELVGTRNFNVADGGAGIDVAVSTVIRNSTSPASVGTLVKNGDGVMQIQGGSIANSYSGGTTINGGSVVLFKNVGVNAIPAGTVTVGDGIGGARADKLIVRNSDQISDLADLTVASSGLLDLSTFNTNETIASLAGPGAVEVGPSSVMTVNGDTSTVFSGSISGAGSLVKGGGSTLELSGISELAGGTLVNGSGKLLVSGKLGGSVAVGIGATLGGNGTVAGPVTAFGGGIVAPGITKGILSTGSLDLQAGSTLALELGGSARGTGYDALNVTGGISLAGDLQGSLIDGFMPTLADIFFILVNDGTDAVNGTFNNLPEGTMFNIGGSPFQITYVADFATGQLTGGNDIALVVPEPGSASALFAGVASLLGMRRFRRRR